MTTVRELAKMIDHSALHPIMTDEILIGECEIAKKYDVASVCIKPYAIKLAVEILNGTDVKVGTVIGFPHGNSAIDIKVQETLQAVQDGATEIDMVVNIGKVLSKDWNYIKEELKAINDATVKNGAILKVIFGNDYLPEDSFKIKLCELCSEVGVAFVKTSTGYDYMKDAQGNMVTKGATDYDLALMRKHSASHVQVKAAGGVRTLKDLLRVKDLGVTRAGATATVVILEEAKKIYEGSSDEKAASTAQASSVGSY